MTLMRWQPMWHRNPLEAISAMQREMNRLFEEALPTQSEETLSAWNPRVDVTELEDRYEVTCELPGMERDNVKVELQENVLSVSGEKKEESERKDRSLYVCERTYGQFRRSFRFPTAINASQINAEFKNGVLTVKLPKSEEAKPKQIEVKIH